MREPYPQVTRHIKHVINKRRCIFTFTNPMDPKLSRIVTQDEQTPLTKSRNTLIKWSRDKSKMFHLHFHKAQGLQTQQVVTRMRRPYPTCHVTPRSCRHVATIHQQVVYVCSTFSSSSLIKTNRFHMIMAILKMCSLPKIFFVVKQQLGVYMEKISRQASQPVIFLCLYKVCPISSD